MNKHSSFVDESVFSSLSDLSDDGLSITSLVNFLTSKDACDFFCRFPLSALFPPLLVNFPRPLVVPVLSPYLISSMEFKLLPVSVVRCSVLTIFSWLRKSSSDAFKQGLHKQISITSFTTDHLLVSLHWRRTICQSFNWSIFSKSK